MSLDGNRKVELNFKSTEAQRRGFLSSPCLLASPLNHPVAEWSALFPEVMMDTASPGAPLLCSEQSEGAHKTNKSMHLHPLV